MQRTSLKRAAAAGLIYAAVMCAWRLFRDAPELGDLAALTTFHFAFFTVCYWLAMNAIERASAKKS